jgi:hypothetical protein
MSLSANIRSKVSELLPDHEVSTPSSGHKAGMVIVCPDGSVATYRMAPGEPWRGEMDRPDGSEHALPSVPKGLTAGATAQVIAESVAVAVADVA